MNIRAAKSWLRVISLAAMPSLFFGGAFITEGLPNTAVETAACLVLAAAAGGLFGLFGWLMWEETP